MSSHLSSVALAASLCCALAGCNSDTPPDQAPGPVGALQVQGGELADPAALPIQKVTVGADGWVAVWHEVGEQHTLAGAFFLTKGTHTDLVVPLDPPVGAVASPDGFKLRVSLHVDAPADGAFSATDARLDGDDPVVKNATGLPIVGTIDVTLATEPNTLVADDQTITQDPPKVMVTASLEAVPAYVVLTDAAGTVVGTERLWDKQPRQYTISVVLPRAWGAVPLTAAIYAAAGDAPDFTKPVRNLAGVPVTRTFNVTYPPVNVLEAHDQTLNSWGYKLTIDRVALSELPAWVAIYEDADGAPGALLGKAPMTTSPAIALGVDLTRFVAPVEKLWVAVRGDAAPVGTLSEADPYLLGTNGQALLVAITVTNGACDGLKTKRCDAAKPNVISWLDRCDAPSPVTTPCGEGALCDDSGPYVMCKAEPDACAGIAGTHCVAEDPSATYFVDHCGAPLGVAARCGATSVCVEGQGASPSATCKLAASCAGNATKACDPNDAHQIAWLDRCGVPNGNMLPCGATSTCDDSGAEATCILNPGCGGNTTLGCNPADSDNLYWYDTCDGLTGATVPCGAGLACDDADGEARCINPNPCTGPSQKFCDPDDLSAVYWLDGCGVPKASTIPCGAGHACTEVGGEARCVATDTCGGNTKTVCAEGDPGHAYWVDACGALTGSTYPCGVASCVESGGEASCAVLGTCADTKLRVCDADDPTTIRLTDGCGEDLGVFATCNNGKRCSEPTAGAATCACVPTDDVQCFGKHFLYEPSGMRKLDSCGNPSGPVVTSCANGEICFEAASGPTCTTSLSDTESPMVHRGCSFIDYVTYKTDLEVDCRCRRQAPTPDDIHVYNDGGNLACATQSDSWALGWTMGAGPHFRHLLHSFNGGGVYSASHHEIFATKHFTDATYQGAGMVVGYDIRTGARRIVSGRFPTEAGVYQMFGSGFESQRAVGVQRFEATTLPGAWDLEMGADGMLYVWGSRDGNHEVTRVDPDSGARTLVWRQALEGDASASAYGQCFSTRAKATFFGGFVPVQLEDHAFTMDAAGNFYLGFRNESAEGNGVVRITADGAGCTVISRWNGTMGLVASGAAPQYSTIEGFGIHDGKLYASLQIGKRLLAIDLAAGSLGQRTLIANPAGSVESTPGQSTMFWDATRSLLITAGAVQSYSATAIDLGTGLRQSLFLTAPGMPIASAPPWETGAHGAIDNGNYMGYGALVMDPDDNDHVYLVIKWGLIKYELSTGNSYVMSQ